MRRGLLAVALAGIVAGCGPFWDGIGGSSDEIADAVKQGEPFRLADVTGFEWDRFCVFGPYLSNDSVDRRLGFDWGKAENSDYRLQDGGSLLVFVRDGEVVHAFDQPNTDGYFVCLGNEPVTPEQAMLRVKQVREGGVALDYVLRPGRVSRSCPL
jgi:hypothetical protein